MLQPLLDMKAYGRRPAGDVRRVPASDSDERARFQAVFDTNYHLVLGYALRRTRSREDAEDVVGETFLTAWRRLKDVPAGSAARPWLYGVARNALANHRRGERRRERLTGRLHAEPPWPSHVAAAGDALSRTGAAFGRLRDADREILALVAWEELDPGEIATVLGCSRNAARIRLHRASRRLARELKEADAEDARATDGSARPLVSAETQSER
jgi:RNA polymerase sigma factor (sigma-70 family)